MKSDKSKILIVDDIPTNIQVLGSVLRKAGYEVAFTDNGADAILKALHNSYDLILLDIMMPGMDGFEVCRVLKESDQTRNIPIIFLTAKTDSDSMVKGFEIGAVDYVSKPFKAPELLARVNTHIMLKRTTEELIETNRMKDKLLSIIAHDLRGPVGNFSSALQYLIENFSTYDPQVTLEILNELDLSASKVFNLLENLLTWARNQNKNIDFNPTKINISNLIAQTCELLGNSLTQKSIHCTVQADEDIEVLADENMTNIVLRNLLSNAIKFSHPEGQVNIQVLEKGNFAEISIADNGIGIKEENLNKILSPDNFFTTYGTSNEKGTGLGLKLCVDFVEINGGKFKVDSKPDKGSVFSFTLPLYKPVLT